MNWTWTPVMPPRLKVWDALEKVKPVSSFRNVNSPADK